MVRESYRSSSERMRAIPRSTMVDIQMDKDHRGELSPADIARVAALSEELHELGIVREVETMRGISSEEELVDVMREAENLSVAEEELNSDYHSPRLDEALMGLEGGSNPLMEKFDDYEGLDYNPAFRAREKINDFRQGSKATRGRTL